MNGDEIDRARMEHLAVEAWQVLDQWTHDTGKALHPMFVIDVRDRQAIARQTGTVVPVLGFVCSLDYGRFTLHGEEIEFVDFRTPALAPFMWRIDSDRRNRRPPTYVLLPR